MKNELIWLETEYISNDITFQPVLINGTLWYTVFDNGYNNVFSTMIGLHMYLNGDASGRSECFDTEEEMIKYLEEL